MFIRRAVSGQVAGRQEHPADEPGELLRPESVVWYANSSPDHVQPGALPAVIGLDRELVAVFWLG